MSCRVKFNIGDQQCSSSSLIRSVSRNSECNLADIQIFEEEKVHEAKFFNILVLISFILADLEKKPRSYKIGVFTVTLTISFVVLLYSMLDILPLVLIKQVQDIVGEADFVYSAPSADQRSQSADENIYSGRYGANRVVPGETSLPFINYTQLVLNSESSEDFEGFSPRWIGVADFASPEDTEKTTSGVVMILDTELGVEIGLGRDFTKTILGKDQTFVTLSALKYLGIDSNGVDEVQIIIDTRGFLSELYDTSNPLTRGDITTLAKELNLGLEDNGEFTISAADVLDISSISGKLGHFLIFQLKYY